MFSHVTEICSVKDELEINSLIFMSIVFVGTTLKKVECSCPRACLLEMYQSSLTNLGKVKYYYISKMLDIIALFDVFTRHGRGQTSVTTALVVPVWESEPLRCWTAVQSYCVYVTSTLFFIVGHMRDNNIEITLESSANNFTK